jgi:hypothetical protein
VSAIAGAVCGVVLLLASLIVWSASFRRVYVVNTAGERISVSIDGEDLGSVGVADARPEQDVTFGTFSVRTDRSHRLVLRRGDGPATDYTLDPATATGWVVAPDAAAHDLCIVATESVYGDGAAPAADPKVLSGSDDVVVLHGSYDDFFRAPPKTVQVQSGETARRWTLRALRCSRLGQLGVALPPRAARGR